ncbi:hypothetical protein FHETE_11351, partial [Fusarium heterosporum]
MQGSVSYPAALGSSKWIASFLANHRNDDDIYVRTSHNAKSEAKFSNLLKKTKGELRSMLSGHKKKSFASKLNGKSNAIVHLFLQLILVLIEAELPTYPSNSPAKKNETKSTWTNLFDTKSGNKLHKRAKSAPTTTYVPHVLETINEEVEDTNSSEKTLNHKPLPSTDCRTEEDDDAASFMTTCTVLIQQLALEDVPEEDEEEGRLQTAIITTITPAPEVTTIEMHSSNSSREATANSQESPVSESEITRAIGGRTITPSRGPCIRFECTGALPPQETLVSVDRTRNEAKASELKIKTSSSIPGLKSMFTKVLGTENKLETIIKAEEKPKTGNPLKILRHKAQHSFSFGRLADFLQFTGTHVRSSRNTDQKNERPATKCNKTNDTCEPLKWNLPPCNNEMGELIRSFSGPLPDCTASVHNSRHVEAVHIAQRSPSESSDIPEHDISVENLPPMPAILPPFLRQYDGEVSMQINDERVQELIAQNNREAQPKTSDGRRLSTYILNLADDSLEDSSRYSQDIEIGPFPDSERMENAFRRHVELVTNTYDFSQHATFVDTCNPLEVQEPREERLVREIIDKPEELLKKAESPTSHISIREEASQDAEQRGQDADVHFQDNKTIFRTEEVLEIVHPIPIRRITSNILIENDDQQSALCEDQHNVATFAMVPSVEWHAQSVPEGSEGNPPTCSAMKEIEHQDQAEFFKSLQNCRIKTPDRLYGRSGFSGVMPWTRQIAELASKNQVVRDEDAELFYQQPPSATGSNDSVSDLSTIPEAEEVRAALRHPQAPLIDDCEPDCVAECYKKLRKSVMTD